MFTATVGETSSRALGDRRRYQLEVERLLDQIRRQVHDVRRFRAAGAQGRALSHRKQRLEQTRRRLANVISATSRSARAA